MEPHDASADGVAAQPGLALREAKRALRAQVIARRDALDRGVRERDSATIAASIASQPAFATARVVLLTVPFGSEWDSRALVRRALASGQTVLLPRVNRHTRMLDLCAIRDIERDVVAGHLGIPEPAHDRPGVEPSEVDVVVVPGVAFDREGGRLGYGGGFYDRLLPMTRNGVARIAGAFDVQIVDRIPRGPHDLAVDCIVTPTALMGHRM